MGKGGNPWCPNCPSKSLTFPFSPTSGGRNIEKLKCFNRLLSAVLQEYKGRCEGLSMQLGQQEAEATALRLALQYRSVHPTHDSPPGKEMDILKGQSYFPERNGALSEKYLPLPWKLT